MPLAALCGLGDARLTQIWDEPLPVVDPKRVAIIGARDLDPGEKINLRESGVMVMGMEQIDRLGMVTVMEKAIERVRVKQMAFTCRLIWTPWIRVTRPVLERRCLRG